MPPYDTYSGPRDFGLGISDSEIQPRNSEVPRFRGPEVRPRNPGLGNVQLGNVQLGNVQLKICNSKYATCKYASRKYTSRKYGTQDMQLGNAHLRNAHLGKMRLKSTKGNEIIKTYN